MRSWSAVCVAFLLLPAAAFAANDRFAGAWKLDRIEGGDGIAIEVDMELALDGENLLVSRVIRRADRPRKPSSSAIAWAAARAIA